MQKQEISSIVKDVRVSHDHWLIQGKVILDGINLDRVDEPVDHADCCFGEWCESNKQNILSFKPLKELQKLHQEFHQTYSDLFFDSMRKYNPSTMDQLVERFELLKQNSDEFNSKLNEVEVEIYRLSDDEFDDLIANSITEFKAEFSSRPENKNTVSNDKKDTEDSFNDKSEVSLETNTVNVNSVIEIDDFNFDTNLDLNSDKNESENNKKITKNNLEESQGMRDIDINEYNIDQNQNPFDELETLNPIKELPQNNLEKITKKEEPLEIKEKSFKSKPMQAKIRNADVLLEQEQSSNRLISLKEQSIIQLKEEKELSKLELSHIESTQELTQKSLDQLEKYFILKQQEIEVEQTNNIGFLDFKNKAKIQIEKELFEIKDKKTTLRTEIHDLEQKNDEDEIKLEENNKKGPIEKQFEELKRNKNIGLNDLLDHKQTRENDLAKLKEQVLLIEEEITEVCENIDKKQKDLLDLEEKESIKNEQRNVHKQEIEKVQTERNDSIASIQKEFDLLAEDQQVKQIELDTINFQVNELNKNNAQIESDNSNEIKDLVKQQESKEEKISETEKLMKNKQTEITDIDLKIVAVERSLNKLKSEQTEELDVKDELEELV